MGNNVGDRLIKVCHPHRQVGIGEELVGLGHGAVGKQRRNALLDRALFEQVGEGFCTF
jgi:hypothetical protein